jgi:inhibitor of cysteine peptidase
LHEFSCLLVLLDEARRLYKAVGKEKFMFNLTITRWMMFAPLLLLLLLAGTGCGAATGQPIPVQQPPPAATSTATPDTLGTTTPISPTMDDTTSVVTDTRKPLSPEIITDTANVEEVTVTIMESMPVQVNVVASGYLADGCTMVDEITQKYDESTFTITIQTARPADMMCTQAIVPFEETIALDVERLTAGMYTVNVNGVTETFELESDNVAP